MAGATSKETSQVGAAWAKYARDETHLDFTTQSKMSTGQQDVLQTAWPILCRRGISQELLHMEDNWRELLQRSGF